jgi:hypothetical protein
VHELNQVQSKLPPEEQYIQSATAKWVKNADGKEHLFQAAITMLPSQAHLAHQTAYFTADTMYKTMKGNIKQFRICQLILSFTVDPELAEHTCLITVTL